MNGQPQETVAGLYAANHQHPVNRALHALGIPVIACCSIAALLGPGVVGVSRRTAVAGVAAGSALLLVGHAIEGNRPAIFARRSAVFEAIGWWVGGAIRVCKVKHGDHDVRR